MPSVPAASANRNPASPEAARLPRWWWLGVCALLLLALAGFRLARRHGGGSTSPLQGYEDRLPVFQREYHHFYGRLMRDPNAERLFEEAAAAIAARRNGDAIALLRTATRDAALPVIFNNLGVLFADGEDRTHATAAFGEALARAPDYALVRQNLVRLGGFNVEMGRPVAAEEEPNNSSVNANLIALGRDVRAEIANGTADVDYFRFIAPPAPRDHLLIRIEHLSPTMELGMRMYDGEQGLVLDHRPEIPGDPVVEYIAPRTNTTWYLEIRSAHETSGEYTVRVSPMHSFDAYEPNDNIFAAARIEPETTIDANIMDVEDTDFYSFESPRAGTVTIELENRSPTLIPALTTFGPDMRNSGFGPDVHQPGASLHHTMAVEAHRTYFLQVWAQARTSGSYSLTIH